MPRTAWIVWTPPTLTCAMRHCHGERRGAFVLAPAGPQCQQVSQQVLFQVHHPPMGEAWCPTRSLPLDPATHLLADGSAPQPVVGSTPIAVG